ncbi:hypothetical protein C1752_13980 [Acaryochloris thomasi RCC1774]|uniref:DUF3352 domain-containing protein n=1 Tax=Acaryochloris thomasi RCC1774 TaxID=1764569 RepID=A0A2W1JN67_9CYAN|nr:DUF3352 domain-containing protein [Acaryochloris thomasi]PZD70347.1 hypothetical protein C1752_13980 [Acaryochloris thomasi RCC1774]
MMTRRFPWIQLIAIFLCFCMSGGMALAETPPATEINSGPATARFVPQQSPLLLSVNPKQLPDSGNTTSLLQWPQVLLTNAGVNYARDLKPWVSDELMFALTGPVQQHHYLFAVTTRGAKESQACIEQIWQQQVSAGQPLSFEQYSDISLISTQFKSPQPLGSEISGLQPFEGVSTAIVDDRYVLVANSASVLRAAIDSSQSESLTNTSDYQQAVTHLKQEQQDGFVYADLSAFSRLSSPPYRSLAVQLGQTRQGLLAETVLVADSSRSKALVTPTVTAPIRALDYIPASSPLVASGVNLQQLWTQLSADLKGYDPLDQWVRNTLKQGGQQWSINLPREVFSNVTGEYAVAMLPSSDPFTAAQNSFLGADWLFVHDDGGQELTQVLDKAAQKQNIGVIPYSLADHQVSTWAHLVSSEADNPSKVSSSMVLNAEVTGAFSVEADHRILATSLAALKQGLTEDAIANQKDFQAALATLPTPNQGYLYLDWTVMRPLLERKLPKLRQLETLLNPWSRQLTSVTLTNYGETPTIQRSQMLLRFADS